MGNRIKPVELDVDKQAVVPAATKVPQWLYALIGISLTVNLGLGVSLMRRKN